MALHNNEEFWDEEKRKIYEEAMKAKQQSDKQHLKDNNGAAQRLKKETGDNNMNQYRR